MGFSFHSSHVHVVLYSAVNLGISAYYRILICAVQVFNICSINYCTYCNFQVENLSKNTI